MEKQGERGGGGWQKGERGGRGGGVGGRRGQGWMGPSWQRGSLKTPSSRVQILFTILCGCCAQWLLFCCKDLVAPLPPFHSPSNTPHPPTQIWLARSPHPPPAPPFQHKNAWGLLHNPGPMGPCTWGLLEKGLLPSTGCPAFGAPCVNRICAVIPP